MIRTVWVTNGLTGISFMLALILNHFVCDFKLTLTFLLLGFYRGVTPGVTGSLATGATYFGVIESTKKWVEESHPSLSGHWAHFIAGAIGNLIVPSPDSYSLASLDILFCNFRILNY